METKPIKKHLNRLLLDPNNYRFIDRPEYKQVSDEQIADARVQQRTAEFLKGKNNENIADLINSFKTNLRELAQCRFKGFNARNL